MVGKSPGYSSLLGTGIVVIPFHMFEVVGIRLTSLFRYVG
jgi:hypothetical protein